MFGKSLKVALLAVSFIGLASGSINAASYDHEITSQKMTFAWKVDGSNLNVKISAPTKGWVGIGFNPSKEMKDAKFVLGYVKEGTVIVLDHFGTGDTKHDAVENLGGKSDVTLVGGSEEADVTTVEFTLPLISTDTKGGKIDPAAETTVLLAFGPDNDSLKVRHKFRAKLSVNLTTGTYK